MRTARPHAAVWLDVPRSTYLRARFTGDGDIHFMFGDPNDEVNVVFEPPVLARLVEVASELLAARTPDAPELEGLETRRSPS